MLKLVRNPIETNLYEIFPDPNTNSEFYRMLADSLTHQISAYSGFEPSQHLTYGNFLVLTALKSLEAKYNVRPVFLNATEHKYLNLRGMDQRIADAIRKELKSTLEPGEISDQEFDRIIKIKTEERTREKIAQNSKVIAEEITHLFTTPTIINGSDFQFVDAYWGKVFENMLKVPLKELIKASTGVVSDENTASAVIYPAAQAADVEYLRKKENVRIIVGGRDQWWIHSVVRDYNTVFGYEVPAMIHTPILISLSGEVEEYESGKFRVPKMSKSEGRERVLYLCDGPEDIRRKINNAACAKYAPTYTKPDIFDVRKPKPLEFNPIAQLITLVIDPFMPQLEIKRPEKYGGPIKDEPRKILKMFKAGEIHPADLKTGVADALVTMNREIGIPAVDWAIEENNFS